MKLLLWASLFGVVSATVVQADPDWTNLGPDGQWDNPSNWIDGTGANRVPTGTDSAHIFPGFTVTTASLLVAPGGNIVLNIVDNNNDNPQVQSLLVSSNFETSTVPGGTLNLNFAGTNFGIGAGGALITGGAVTNFNGTMTMPVGDFIIGTTAATIDPDQVTGTGTFQPERRHAQFRRWPPT
ncbi:MAG: hypothetical protein WDO13_14650 [Verrucomicrobiota bacterium]